MLGQNIGFDLPGLAFAFISGIFSLLSPCGYALLPGYISYYLGSRPSLERTIFSGLACTIGLMTIFSAIGGSASSLGALLPDLIPVLDIISAAIVTLMGISILAEIRLPYVSMTPRISKRKGLVGLYVFGVAYGLAAAGCSAPIFLSILFYAMTKGLLHGTVTFVSYALGMGLPLTITSLLVAEAKQFIIRKIANAVLWLHKISGIVLIIVGVYLFYFYYSTYMV